jgi:hypothetical protein
MHELVVNAHMHTVYSDGRERHSEIAEHAIAAGLDAIIVTDHNVLVGGVEDYYENGDRRVLLLVGEEIHDQARQPQKNHLLVIGANQELAPLAWSLERLLEGVRRSGGLAFIAHPNDPDAPIFGETDITWEDWDIQGYTGIELWNAMSEFKSLLKSRLHAIYYALNPQRIASGPFPETLRRWDRLLASGQRVAALAGSDAHALPGRMGPLRRTLFPYEFHFRAINNHLMVKDALTGEVDHDRDLIIEALATGRSFIGYDLPASTRGFRFTAHGLKGKVTMGEEITAQNGVTLQIRLPLPVECRLIRNGENLRSWERSETCAHITTEPGIYRVEAYIEYLGKRRGWIFSNPIYVK